MRSLLNILQLSPTETLKKIAVNRNIEAAKSKTVKDKKQLAQLLANEINRRDSLLYAIQTCNMRELRLLQVLVTKEPSDAIYWRGALSNLVYKNETSVNDTLQSLTEKGLAFRTGEHVFVSEQLRSQVPVSLADRYSVDKCLSTYDAPAIKRLMDNHGLNSSTKGQNIERLVSFLRVQSNMERIISQLSEDETQVLNMILSESGAVTPVQIVNAIGSKYRDDFFRYDWQDRWKKGQENNPIDRLLGKGLIYAVAHSYGYNFYLVVPYDLIAVIADRNRANLWDSAPPRVQQAVQPPPFTTRHENLVKDVVSLLGSFALMDMQRTNTGYIHKTALKNAAKLLSTQDDRYASFLYAMLRDSQMIRMDPDKEVYRITPRGLSWLAKDSFGQETMLYDTWALSHFWGEMYEEPLQKGNAYRYADMTASIRRAGLSQVALADSDGFYVTESLESSLSFHFPLLLNGEGNLDYGLVESMTTFLHSLINECLYWLGAVELGWQEQPKTQSIDGDAPARGRGAKKEPATTTQPKPVPIFFRLTPLGKSLLGLPGAETVESAPVESHFIVQANSEIFLTPYLAPSLRYTLTLFTEIPKAGASNVVLLSKDAVRKALDRGLGIDEIMAFLQKYSRTGVPQNVEYLLREVAGKHGHIHIGSVSMYLTTDTPLVMKELQARREFQPFFVRNLTDTIALLSAEDGSKLLRDLRKAGYLPVSDDYDSGKLTIPEVSAGTAPIEVAIGSPSDRTLVAAPSRQKTSQIDDLIDWKNISKDDVETMAFEMEPQQDVPKDAIQNLENIRFAMLDSIKKKYMLEMLYTPKNGLSPQVVQAEPRHVMGGFAMIYLPSEKSAKTINLNTVKWVRRV